MHAIRGVQDIEVAVFPEPRRHPFNRWFSRPSISLRYERSKFSGAVSFRCFGVIVNPAGRWIDIPFH
jgi:hypothetical protein